MSVYKPFFINYGNKLKVIIIIRVLYVPKIKINRNKIIYIIIITMIYIYIKNSYRGKIN